MEKPFVVLLDNFNTYVTDMTWAFNGNILVVSSNDGNTMIVHFEPGVLGEPISE
jgi:hypothetical protein